jgi:nitrogen fixation protein NifU and related proteins
MAYDMYQEVILAHYRSPHNYGPLEGADRVGEESNPTCGDHITVRLKLDAGRAAIESARFEGDGCAISVASTSMLTDRLTGLSLDAASRLSDDDVLKALGIPLSPVRVKCALTGFVALGRALRSPATAGTN